MLISMDAPLLLKIPCLLLVTMGFHIAFSRPNPPAPSENCPGVPSLADKLVRGMLMMGTPGYLKVRPTPVRLHEYFTLVLLDMFMVFGAS